MKKSAKLDSEAILKSLPAGFTGVSIPENTRTVFVAADPTEIKYEDASKVVKKIAKDIGLSVVSSTKWESSFEFCLKDKEFNKQMRADAKACFKMVKSFYDKYGTAYKYDDETCESIGKIIRKVNNEE